MFRKANMYKHLALRLPQITYQPMKKLSLLALLLCAQLVSQAQSEIDAIRFARTMPGGTARSIGAGGSFGALGADLSSLSTNPAGLGFYRNSDFGFTGNIATANALSSFDGKTYDQSSTRFLVQNTGVVFANANDDTDWKSFGFGITYNKVANFNQSYRWQGSSKGSIAQDFIARANGVSEANLGSYYEQLAFNSYVIDNTYTLGSDYESPIDTSLNTYKNERVTTKGGLSELNIGFGANYDNKIYFGGTFTMSFLNFSSSRIYSESDPDDIHTDFIEMSLNETYSIANARNDASENGQAVGFSGKFGIIYRPSAIARFGIAVHTPTFWPMRDRYNATLESQVYYTAPNSTRQLYQSNVVPDQEGQFFYRLRTPMRATASAAFFIQKQGFLTAEVDYVPYDKTRFNFGEESADNLAIEESLNSTISAKYAGAVNVRLGGEYAYKAFRLRAGYGFYGSPFGKDVPDAEQGVLHSIAGGMGIRGRSLYLDLAYQHLISQFTHIPYLNAASAPVVNTKMNTGNIVVTLGFRF